MELQKQLARKVLEEDTLNDEEMEYVCGIDVSYLKNTANCSALIMKRRSWQVIEGSEHEYSDD